MNLVKANSLMDGFSLMCQTCLECISILGSIKIGQVEAF
jgi:hypothetical protein